MPETQDTISREEAQDHFDAAVAQRDFVARAFSDEALQLRLALSTANRKIKTLEAQVSENLKEANRRIAELEKATQPETIADSEPA